MLPAELIRFFLEAAITTSLGIFAIYLGLFLRERQPSHYALAGLCFAFAVASAINLLTGSGVLLWLRPVNIFVELLISPFIYVFLVQTRHSPPELGWYNFVHVFPASLTLATWFAWPGFPLNSLMIAVHAFYLILIAQTWKQHRGSYSSHALKRALTILVGFTVVFVVLRTAIGLEASYGGQFFRGGLGYVMILSAILLLAIGMILTVLRNPHMLAFSEAFIPYAGSDLQPGESELILERLDKLMNLNHAYRDPDLNLNHLAKIVGAPARHISQTINDHLGTSVPLYVNKHRVDEVASLLDAKDKSTVNITRAIYDAGFGSKSTFHREFKRVYGVSPSTYRR